MKTETQAHIKAVFLHPAILFLLFVALALSYWINLKANLIKSGQGKTTVCKVIDNNSRVAYEFYVDGQRQYGATGSKYTAPYFYVGEEYEVLYDPESPETRIIYWEYPHVNDTVKTALTYVQSIEKDGWQWPIKFTYTVNGQSYTRLQLFPDDIAFDPDKKYQVTYFVHRPEIGYLLFPESKHPYVMRF